MLDPSRWSESHDPTLATRKSGLGTPRLNSAIQVLTDLALLVEDDDGITHLTKMGRELLELELQEGDEQ